MNDPNKHTREKEHHMAKRKLLPKKLLKTDYEWQYSPLDVPGTTRAALTSVACNNCRVRKSKVCPPI
jgi:hypothetical protein